MFSAMPVGPPAFWHAALCSLSLFPDNTMNISVPADHMVTDIKTATQKIRQNSCLLRKH